MVFLVVLAKVMVWLELLPGGMLSGILVIRGMMGSGVGCLDLIRIMRVWLEGGGCQE